MMWYGAAGWWMFLSMLVFWAGAIALVVWAVRATSDRPAARARNGALEILEERFARGEIEQDEFEQRRRTLERG